MKFFVFVFLFFILTVLPLSAAEMVEQATPPTRKQTAPPKKINNPQPPVKIKNFQPTERIKADMVVAFPADI